MELYYVIQLVLCDVYGLTPSSWFCGINLGSGDGARVELLGRLVWEVSPTYPSSSSSTFPACVCLHFLLPFLTFSPLVLRETEV